MKLHKKVLVAVSALAVGFASLVVNLGTAGASLADMKIIGVNTGYHDN